MRKVIFFLLVVACNSPKAEVKTETKTKFKPVYMDSMLDDNMQPITVEQYKHMQDSVKKEYVKESK